VRHSVVFAAEFRGESFLSSEVTIGKDSEEVDAHTYQVSSSRACEDQSGVTGEFIAAVSSLVE
jgi:hypothetical protein